MTFHNQNKNQKSPSSITCKKTPIMLNGFVFLLLSCFLLNGCTEPYILETNTYEEALVVEATITNELKKQEITLTKTARFEDKEIQIEKGAKVFITDNTGIQYDFKEESGKYISTTEFQAVSGKEYRLNIKTSDGRSFESSTETLTPINPMQEVKAAVETKDSIRGVGIRVNSFDPTNTAKYYRYEYEETYKIIAPKWVPSKSIATSEITIGIIPNPTNTRICYSTKKNTELLLTNTNNLNEARLNFLVRFISNQNYIITHRYSILVKQYVESLASFTYYTTLKKLSGSGSILYPTQPGFINGNIKAVNNENDKILGYFDVASVSTKRIYFNYEDLFPGEFPPPYYTNCDQDVYPLCFGPFPCRGADLIQDINLNRLAYQFHEGIDYRMVHIECGDCTSFSSNIKPLFWED
ncbi:uncharacterized protein DUF4249 [Flavobacterium sp. 103]|uniref:DUF4249 domain-containing protein n=1 Tax=Flavobacterium sp. 103 TaxID=2135624 RepID=UPI000D5DA629|nr:DUF4249 domain-containing protein [Flavobacterium sp. 103]PVX45207.1 uncharacterized protein DUF4249 [Flavobacterium sp. 103]